ncbi:interleukin-3 receptor class 2 subunit beta-like isoform X2 [Lithobates pipiens]
MMLMANCRASEMRKNSIVTYCVTFCLLSAVTGNQGSKLLDSLSCIRLYPQKKITCTWSENNFSGNLVNMTLKVKDTEESACQKKSVPGSSLTHSNWTCDVAWATNWNSADVINFSFVPERKLETRLYTEEEKDEAKPQNLQCKPADGNFTCSWQIRKEIAESIDFVLFYYNSEKGCQPECQQFSDYHYCHCNIANDSQLNTSDFLKTISVKPQHSFKGFTLCLNYKLPPINLKINETKKGEVFTVSWKSNSWNSATSESENFKYVYEFCYWTQSDLKKEIPDNCPNVPINIGINQDPSVILQLGNQLTPSSSYSLMVRVHLKEGGKKCYQGPWSEWSEVQTLTTKAVLSLTLLYVSIPACIIVLAIVSIFGYKALIRYTRLWDESIPNPNKSAIIKGLQKTKKPIICHEQNGSCLPYEEHLYVEPYNDIMMGTSSVSKEPPYYYNNEEHISKLNSQLIPQEDIECFILCDQIKEDYPTASIVDGYKPFTDLESEQESKDVKDSQFMFSAFDGPYLFSESNL